MALRREVRWLLSELPELVSRGVLDSDQATRLRDHYATTDAQSEGVGGRVIGALGATLIGLGIVLLVAANWDELGRVGRTVLCFGLLLLGQAVAAFALVRKRDAVGWTEGSALFLVSCVGAAIALIGQTYHWGGGIESFLWTWLWLSVPVIYALDSRSVACLALCGTLGWLFASFEDRPPALRYALLIAVQAPYLWRLRSPEWGAREGFVGLVAVVTLPLGVLVGWESWSSAYVVTLAAALAGALFSAQAVEAPRVHYYAPAAFIVGALAAGSIIVALSYAQAWDFATELARVPDTAVGSIGTLAVGLGAGGLCALGVRAFLREGDLPFAAIAALPLAVLLGTWGAQAGAEWKLVAMLAMNAWGAAIAVGGLVMGVQQRSIGRTNAALLLLAALIFARFGDLEWSFAARGVAFITLGLGFLFLNLRLRQSGGAAQ